MTNHEIKDIWVVVEHRDGILAEETFGLVAEARRFVLEFGGGGPVTAVALGHGLKTELERLGPYGVDRVLYIEDESLDHYHGELFARVLFKRIKSEAPLCIFMAQSAETADLSARLAALLDTALVTRAIDFQMDERGKATAVRPVANGYLFEELTLHCEGPPIVCFLPAVLSPSEPGPVFEPVVRTEPMDEPLDGLKTKVVKIIEAAPEDLALDEADIIVVGGRGVGKGASFDVIHELAGALGGSVGGTRPVIDRQILPYDRQIGQTGETVAPRLIINCGVSGANEYTAGMEKSQFVIAIDTDPRARIFRFADVGVVGDLHELLPLLISRLKETIEN